MATTVDGTSHWSVGPEALGPAAGTFRPTLKDQAAVVAAKVGDVAVIGPTGEEIPIAMTNGEVRNYPNNQGRKAANEALKYLRDHRGENGAGVPLLRAMDVTQAHLGRGLSIPVMHRRPNAKGDERMYYWFDTRVFRHVDWKAMLANLPISKINEMLGQSHVCRIGLEWVPGTYDHNRRHAAMTCKGAIRKPFGLLVDEKHRAIKGHDADCEDAGSIDFGLPASSVCSCRKKLLLLGMLANLPQFRAESTSGTVATHIGLSMDICNMVIMGFMVLGMLCSMVPGGRRQARREKHLPTRSGSDSSSGSVSEDPEAPDDGWTPLYVKTKANVEVGCERRSSKKPSNAAGSATPSAGPTKDELRRQRAGTASGSGGYSGAAQAPPPQAPEPALYRPEPQRPATEPRVGQIIVNICDIDKDAFWRMAFDHADRMGGVPVSFMHTELNAQLIAYLERSGVRGGLTAVRKAQLRVGAFFVRAVIEAERNGYPFP